ncbi:hypothetical protein PQR15_25825 [Streptomyces lydicus]|nr:hypothetical protein [Streptomyces lydicus]
MGVRVGAACSSTTTGWCTGSGGSAARWAAAAGARRRRPRLAPHLQPFLVFGALVAIAVAASALAGAGYDDFGWARP